MKLANRPDAETPHIRSVATPRPEMVGGATSVVVLTYNSMKTIGECLKSVVSTLGPLDEVLIVDNGSTDGTVQFLSQLDGASPQIRVILNRSNLGFSAGSNVGLRAGKGEFLVLLNPDTIVTPEWIHRMSRQFNHERVGAVGPIVDTVAGHQKVELHAPEGLEGSFSYDGIAEVLAKANEGNGQVTKLLIGCCMMLSRKALDEVGFLDDDLFLGCDDLDISWRLRLAGYKLVIARDAFVHHESHVSFDTLPKPKTDRLVQESWDKMARKLIAHYGMGSVPAPEDIWGIDWFGASPEVWDGASLPYVPKDFAEFDEARAKKTAGTLAAKIANDTKASRLIEIGDKRRLTIPKIDSEHICVPSAALPMDVGLLESAVVVCDGCNLDYKQLAELSAHALAVVVSLPMTGPGLPDGLPVMFEGTTPTLRDDPSDQSRIWILDRTMDQLNTEIPDDFRPISIITTFNDLDVIDAVIEHTLAQGMRVVVMDNWSTDGTYEKLLMKRRSLLSLERFPAEGPSKTFDQFKILARQEEIALKYPGQWITVQASDELRVAPWDGVTVREGLYMAEQRGCNCVDLTILDFRPVDESYKPGCDLEKTLPYFEFGQHPSCLIQQKTWKQPEERVQFAITGGHAVFFEGKAVYPYKFALKHYSIRSQAHGERKVFGMRQTRWNEEERTKLGWHTHYDGIEKGHSFLRNRDELIKFEPSVYATKYLVERLTGIGTIPGIDWWVALPPDQWK